MPREERARPVDNAQAHLTAGDALVTQGNLSAAQDEFTEAIAAAPERPEGYARRAALWLARGFSDNARSDIVRAQQLGGRTSARQRLQAWALLGIHNTSAAAGIADALIQQDPKDFEAFGLRGLAYLDREQFDESIRDLHYAISQNPQLSARLQPKLAEAYFRRGVARDRDGNTAAAQEDRVQARALGWRQDGA